MKNNLKAILFVMAAFLCLFGGVASAQNGDVKILNDNNFKAEVRDYKGVVLVDFWATWCPPCRRQGPVIDKLAKQYAGKVKFCKFSIDESPQNDNIKTPDLFKIEAIPSLCIFKNGKGVTKFVGFTPEDVLKARLDSILKDK